MLKNRVQYLCEGRCEQKLVNVLKSNGELIAGKVSVYNIAQTNIDKIIRKLNKKTDLIIIVDTDVINEELFCENLSKLKKSRIRYCLCFQVLNLEDELKKCCQKRSVISLIRDFYDVSSVDEFKSKFIEDNALLRKFAINSFDINKLWDSSHTVLSCKELMSYCNIKKNT